MARRCFVLGALLIGLGLAGCTLFETEAERGRYVAVKWCAECHRVGPDEPSGMRPGHVLPPPAGVPSFMAIVARPRVTAGWLYRFFDEPHLPMPGYRLSEDERRDLIAYMLSLRELP